MPVGQGGRQVAATRTRVLGQIQTVLFATQGQLAEHP
jgi:hypothetical protein